MAINGAAIQIEDGNWSKVHNQIWEALCKAPLTSAEFRCLMFLFRKTYGWNKPKDKLSMNQWADATGMDRRAVIRAVQGLLTKKVIIRSDNGKNRPATWGFNKYVEQWNFSATSDKNDTSSDSDNAVTSDNPVTTTSDKNDTTTSDNSVTHKRYIKDSKDKAASPSDNSVTSSRHDENDGRYTIELLRNTGRFAFFAHDARKRAMHLEELYTLECIERGVNLVVNRNDKNLAEGKKSIRDPVGYLASILAEEANPKVQAKPKRRIYFTNPDTGREESMIV